RPVVPTPAPTSKRSAAEDSPRTRARPTTPAGPRERAAVPGDVREATTRRPTKVGDGAVDVTEAPDAAAPAARGVRRSYLVVAAAAVIIVVTVIGVVLSASGGGRPHTDPSVSANGATALAEPPGQPTVTAAYDAAKHVVTFSWTYPGARSGDYFMVAPAVDSPTHQRVDVPHLTVPTTKPATTCLVVSAYHAGNDAGSTASDQVCGGS
ncbi:MAG: hypothetical protein ACTHMS_00665, partial [Jatrophihabitans sp.]